MQKNTNKDHLDFMQQPLIFFQSVSILPSLPAVATKQTVALKQRRLRTSIKWVSAWHIRCYGTQVSGVRESESEAINNLTMLAFATTEKDTWTPSLYHMANISQDLVAPVLQTHG